MVLPSNSFEHIRTPWDVMKLNANAVLSLTLSTDTAQPLSLYHNPIAVCWAQEVSPRILCHGGKVLDLGMEPIEIFPVTAYCMEFRICGESHVLSPKRVVYVGNM